MLTLIAIISACAPVLVLAIALAPAVCVQLLLNRGYRVGAKSDEEVAPISSLRWLETRA